jgi:NMD protein affecting ribosome stability and mRNA decay
VLPTSAQKIFCHRCFRRFDAEQWASKVQERFARKYSAHCIGELGV